MKEPGKVNGNQFADLPPEGSFGTSTFPHVFDITQIRVDIEEQREDIKRIDKDGFKMVSALDTRILRIEDKMGKFTDALSSLRRDFGNIKESVVSFRTELSHAKQTSQDVAAIAGLEGKLNATDTALVEVRQELSTLEGRLKKELSSLRTEVRQCRQGVEELKVDIQDRVSAHDYANDMTTLRAEMSQMRRQMDEMRSRGAERAVAPFPSKELDILTSNISNIRNRASQVETLQMEFEILKGRVERVETASRQSPEDRAPTHPVAQASMSSYGDGLDSQRKRPSSGAGITPLARHSPKRTAYSSSLSNLSSKIYDVPDDWPTPSSNQVVDQKETERVQDSGSTVKLTRSGRIDKRTQRPRRSINGRKT